MIKDCAGITFFNSASVTSKPDALATISTVHCTRPARTFLSDVFRFYGMTTVLLLVLTPSTCIYLFGGGIHRIDFRSRRHHKMQSLTIANWHVRQRFKLYDMHTCSVVNHKYGVVPYYSVEYYYRGKRSFALWSAKQGKISALAYVCTVVLQYSVLPYCRWVSKQKNWAKRWLVHILE